MHCPGREFSALNGGSNARIERVGYWSRLAGGGEEIASGRVNDRYGLAWQIVPKRPMELISDPDPESARRETAAMLKMTKIEVDERERAATAA